MRMMKVMVASSLLALCVCMSLIMALPLLLGTPAILGDRFTLERVLRAAAMPDKTVIVTTLNHAWAAQNSMVDLFLESLRIGTGTARLVDHLVIVALDQKAYDRCLSIHVHCFQLRTDGVDFSGEKAFMSSDYLRMMWRRIEFLRHVLEKGYSFVFTDADILWFRDPFPQFSAMADFQIACDHFMGRPKSLRNTANGGFAFARANKRTVAFYKHWHIAREFFPDKHDQDVFNKIKRDKALAEIGVRIRFLDTKFMSGFCESTRDLEKVCTVHANCCYGLNNKLDDLRLILADWKLYKSATPQERRVHRFSWSAPNVCLHSYNSSLMSR